MFALIWAIAVVFYFFGWSDIFPDLSAGLTFFLASAILLSAAAAVVTIRQSIFAFRPADTSTFDFGIYLLGANLFSWMLNFAYSGIPILKILGGQDIDYRDFGMPTVIVFTMSFNSFLCVYFFHRFLTNKKRINLIYIAVCLGCFVSIFSRGLIAMTAMSMFFLWLSSKTSTLRAGFIAGTAVTFLLVLYIFGVVGNIRMNTLIASQTGRAAESYSSKTILLVGAASQKFKESFVPDEYFWGYLYISSPLSNLEHNVEQEPPAMSLPDVISYGVNEFTWDFISKRYNTITGEEQKKPVLLVQELTVSTIFAESYRYAGWPGMVFMLIFLLLLPFVYLGLLGYNKDVAPLGIAILTNIYFFSFFDNMLIYSGLGLQLLYPFLLKFLQKLSTEQFFRTGTANYKEF
ncbi:MAG: hypothetical protein V4520_17355 [Bacteroidota bacterium]